MFILANTSRDHLFSCLAVVGGMRYPQMQPDILARWHRLVRSGYSHVSAYRQLVDSYPETILPLYGNGR